MSQSTLLKNINKSNRITRRCLIGKGIVSGLELSIDENHHIRISAGTGLSSDGKYIELTKNQEFTFYRSISTPPDYFLFRYKDESPIALWELVSDKEFKETDQPLNPQYNQEKLNPFLKDKVALMYVEQEQASNDDDNDYLYITGDNMGDDKLLNRKYSLRFFLMRQEDILIKLDISRISTQLVWNRLEDDDDYIYSDAYNPNDDLPKPKDINKALNPALRLPEIFLRRFGFSKGDPFDCLPGGPDESVFPTIKNSDDIYNEFTPIIDEAINSLYPAIQKLHGYYGNIIEKHPKLNIQATLDALIDKWEAYKKLNTNANLARHKKEYVQYFYDWLRDLLSAYNELRKLLIDYTFLSMSGADEFPNHFLIGQPLREIVTNIPRPFRHHFKHPPIYNGQADRIQSIKLYFWRILVMIKNFFLPDYIEPAKLDFCNTPIIDLDDKPVFNQLKITPSHFYDKPLGEQTIPYYYFPVARHKYSLHHFWNYTLTKYNSNDQILCYHANDSEDSYTSKLNAIRPLHYNIDKYSFYRIEGFIGQHYEDIERGGKIVFPGIATKLHYLKQKYNLDFNFDVVKLDAPLPLVVRWKEIMAYAKDFNGFNADLLGLEHLGGVQKGGTFIFICDHRGVIVADGSLPYRKSIYLAKDSDFNFNLEGDNSLKDILEIVGTASAEEADELEKLKGVGKETKEVLNSNGIYTFSQVSKMNEDLFDRLNITYYRRKNWITEAEIFSKEKSDNKIENADNLDKVATTKTTKKSSTNKRITKK